MEMANNNEKTTKDLQEQEAAIEVDVTDEAAKEVVEDDAKVEDVSEEAEKSEQEDEKENDSVADDVQKEATEDDEVKEDTSDVAEEIDKEETADDTEKEADNNEQNDESDSDSKSDDTDDSSDKTEADDVADEPSDKEKELMAQIETYKEAEELRELAIMKNQAETQLDATTNKVHDALIKTIKKYDIPEDKTLDELRAESPEKAAILEGLLTKAQEVIQSTSAKLSAQVEEKAKDVLFNKAGKMFEAYKMSEEQAEIAAATFITIMNQVGINDLGEDLAAKVKLSVAQAKMDSPDVVEAIQVKEEVKVEEDVQNDDMEEEAPIVEEEKNDKEEENNKEEVEQSQKPDLSEFMEGIEGSAAKASDVNADNVLAKLNALPFKERTKFYKENMDLINEAMKNARGNL